MKRKFMIHSNDHKGTEQHALFSLCMGLSKKDAWKICRISHRPSCCPLLSAFSNTPNPVRLQLCSVV